MKRSNWVRIRGLGAALAATCVAAAAPAWAQQQGQGNSVIGPPQLRDFQLEPRQRIVTQRPLPTPQPTPPPAAQTPPPPARTQEPRPTNQRPDAARQTPRPAPSPAQRAPETATQPVQNPLTAPPSASLPAAPAPLPPEATPLPDSAPAAPPPAAPTDGIPFWLYLAGAGLLALVGYGIWSRRRAAALRAAALPEPVVSAPEPSPPRAPRPDPVPRPWLELDLVAERATADPEESIVEFELTVRNSGGSTASNIRLQAKLICGTMEQDQEIAAFQRMKPGEHRTLSIPDLPAGQELRIKGRVDVKREEMKALRVEQRLLFIPLVAVNAFYEWIGDRSGQTSKSFLVGREKADSADRMAPFRLDLGPRVYRTVGQRPYKVERRV